MKLTEEQKKMLFDSCESESIKIIKYFEEEKQKQKPCNRLVFAFTLIGAIGSLVAAVTGVIMLFQ